MLTSLQNSYIKKIMSLRTSKGRKKTGLFILEGIKSIKEIDDQWKVESILYTEGYLLKNQDVIKDLEKKYNMLLVHDKVFDQLSDTTTPQGIMAVVEQRNVDMNEILNKDNTFLVLIDSLQDPGNVGTIIRTADAAGAHGILLSTNSVDIYNPKIVRAAMGSLFHLPVVTKCDMEKVIPSLRQKNIKVYAAHLEGARYPYEEDMTKGTAILIGNEGSGLSDNIAKLADTYIKLPMLGKAESLNAAVAASILTYEVVRQRMVRG